MRNLALPAFVKFRDKTLGVAAHTRGLAEPGAAPRLTTGRGARWVGSLDIVPLVRAEAFALRAWLHRMRGQAGSFLLQLSEPIVGDLTRYTDTTTFSDGTTFDDNEGATFLISDVAAGASVIVSTVAVEIGTIVEIGDGSGFQTVRIVGSSGSAPAVNLTVKPAIRRAMTGATITTAGVRLPLRLAGEAPAVPIVPGGRSAGVRIDIEEAY